MNTLKNIWAWIATVLAVIGAIALYVFLSKDKFQNKVAKIEEDIRDVDRDIKKKVVERNNLLKVNDQHDDRGKELDKEIKKAKAKQHSLDQKRKTMRNIIAKYGDK